MDSRALRAAREYVEKARVRGSSDEDIRRTMLDTGWSEADVAEVLGAAPSASRDMAGPREPAAAHSRAPAMAQERTSALLPVLVSVALALAIGWLQARSFQGIMLWRAVEARLAWWSWILYPVLAAGVLCLFRPQLRRQMEALVAGAVAGLVVGRLVLPGAFGAALAALLHQFPHLRMGTRLHWGQAWPLMAALMVVVTVLVAVNFDRLATFCVASGRGARRFVLAEGAAPASDGLPPTPRPMKSVTVAAARAWLGLSAAGALACVALGVLVFAAGPGAGDVGGYAVLAGLAIAVVWVVPSAVASLGLLWRQTWGWWALLAYASLWLVFAGRSLLRSWSGVTGMVSLVLVVLSAGTVVILLRDRPRHWIGWR